MEAREKSVWVAFNERSKTAEKVIKEYVNTFYVRIVITLNLVLLLSTKGCPSQKSPQRGEGEPFHNVYVGIVLPGITSLQ
jgi:hypothetical protein